DREERAGERDAGEEPRGSGRRAKRVEGRRAREHRARDERGRARQDKQDDVDGHTGPLDDLRQRPRLDDDAIAVRVDEGGVAEDAEALEEGVYRPRRREEQLTAKDDDAAPDLALAHDEEVLDVLSQQLLGGEQVVGWGWRWPDTSSARRGVRTPTGAPGSAASRCSATTSPSAASPSRASGSWSGVGACSFAYEAWVNTRSRRCLSRKRWSSRRSSSAT